MAPHPFAEEQVAFPMARHRPVRGLGRPLADVEGPSELTLTVERSSGPAAGGWRGRCAGSGSVPCAAHLGPARTATGRSSRATRASPGPRGTPRAAIRRSAGVTTAARVCPRPPLEAAHRSPTSTASGDEPGPGHRHRHGRPDTGAGRRCPSPREPPSKALAPVGPRSSAATRRPPGHERSPHAQPATTATENAAEDAPAVDATSPARPTPPPCSAPPPSRSADPAAPSPPTLRSARAPHPTTASRQPQQPPTSTKPIIDVVLR